MNGVRRRHPQVWSLRDIRFHHADDDRFLVYSRGHIDTELLLCVVHLDPHEAHDTTVRLDLGALGLPADRPYQLYDELSGDTFVWGGEAAYVGSTPPRATSPTSSTSPADFQPSDDTDGLGSPP